MRLSQYFLSLFMVFSFVGCTGIQTSAIYKEVALLNLSKESTSASNDMITVWVHGTSQNALIRKWHASPAGITTFEELPEDFALKSVARELDAHDSKAFPKSRFYTFGWSGSLSFDGRKQAGQDLDAALRSISDIHQMRHKKRPRLRLITHSHGCNVALNASDQFTKGKKPLRIDELVLLACPVQYATASKLKSPAFKKIYALFSPIDLTQVIDPQGLNIEGAPSGGKLFSERRFAPQHNLAQAQIKWQGYGLTHVGFVRPRFGKALPNILNELRASNAQDMSALPEYVLDIRAN